MSLETMEGASGATVRSEEGSEGEGRAAGAGEVAAEVPVSDL